MKQQQPLIVVSRSSPLAKIQAQQVISLIQCHFPQVRMELRSLQTKGDVSTKPLHLFRGEGVFVKELQRSLIAGEGHMAVHSLKDIPMEGHADLIIEACLRRSKAHDVLITRFPLSSLKIADLPQGTRVGTSSPRRMYQLQKRYSNLLFKDIRGNVHTRLQQLDDGFVDALALSYAGLERLDLLHHLRERTYIFSFRESLPSPGQGIIAIECRKKDRRVRQLLSTVTHEPTQICAQIERTFTQAMNGNCEKPLSAYAHMKANQVFFTAAIYDPHTDQSLRIRTTMRTPHWRRSLSTVIQQAHYQCKKKGICLDSRLDKLSNP